MTFEELNRGNSLHQAIMETRNRIRILEVWIAELKKDATVIIGADKPGGSMDPEKYIYELHGTKVLPLVVLRLGELKAHLEKLENEFNSL
ncbi:MAG: hypothetical protein IJ615_11305 [Bacteroidaceae bacterium]|nr:hypothetical protein [Bacteroidaceae bacterium]